MTRGSNLRYSEGRAVCPSCGWGMPWHGAPVYVGHLLVVSGGILNCPSCGKNGLVIESAEVGIPAPPPAPVTLPPDYVIPEGQEKDVERRPDGTYALTDAAFERRYGRPRVPR